jgi:hypothetical protein
MERPPARLAIAGIVLGAVAVIVGIVGAVFP